MTITHDMEKKANTKETKRTLELLKENENNSIKVTKKNLDKFLKDFEKACGESARYSQSENCIYILENQILFDPKFLELIGGKYRVYIQKSLF